MSLSRLTKKDMMKRIKNAGIGSEIQATDVLQAVEKALGEQFDTTIAKEVKPLFFRNGTVTLESTSSVIAQEVRLQEEKLRIAINNALGKEMVTHFLWRISA